MSRFLLTTLPTNDLGLIVRSLPIASELGALGHQVQFTNPARAPGKVIADAGFANVLSDHSVNALLASGGAINELVRYVRSGHWRQRHRNIVMLLAETARAIPLRRAPPTDTVWNMDHAGALMGMLDAGFVRANCRALIEVIGRSNPDVVVDFWNPFAAIAARVTGKPLVTVIQADAHPLSRGFLWWQDPPVPPPTPAATLNRVLAEYALPPIERAADLSVGDLTLVVGSPDTDPLPATANVTYIGLTLWQRAGAALPAWLQNRLRDRPLVWVYSGNPRYGGASDTLDSAVVLDACRAALADQDLDVVLTTGHHRLPSALLPLPANMRHESYLPGPALAQLSDVLVHHGGYGSCQTGLGAGKPAVIIPTYSERESNARRLAALGAAEVVAVQRVRGRKTVDALQVRRAVQRILQDHSFSDRARQAGDTLRRYGGPPRAARLIADFAQQCGRSPRPAMPQCTA